MLSTRIRLFIAFLISLVTLSGTIAWYYLTDPFTYSSTAEVLGQVQKVRNEASKRPGDRLLWRPVELGDSIRDGETIRTQAKADMLLQFEDGSELRIEPDTLVVISKSQDRIGLNLVEGSLLAEKSGPRGGGLVLESESGQIDLSSANAVISKDAGSRLSLNVLSGSLQIGEQGEVASSGELLEIGATGELTKKQNIQLVSPKIGYPILRSPEELVTFTLAEQLGTQGQIVVFEGDSRQNLKQTKEVPLEGKTFSVPLATGEQWVKFEFQEAGRVVAESSVIRYQIWDAIAIQPLFPQNLGEYIRSAGKVRVVWPKAEHAEFINVQVYQGRKILVNQTLKNQTDLEIPLEPGAYNLVLQTKYPGRESTMASDPIQFVVLPDKAIEKPPIDLRWGLNPEERVQYHPTQPQALLKWTLANRHEDVFAFQVDTREVLGEGQLEGYVNSKTWPKEQLQAQLVLPKFGVYEFKVMALDQELKSIATLEELRVEVQEMPRLGPIVYLDASPLRTADGGGNLEINWHALEGAKAYRVRVVSDNDKVLVERDFKSPKASLNRMLPGNFKFEVQAIDQWGRAGAPNSDLRIEVPETSNIRAPAMKRVRVR